MRKREERGERRREEGGRVTEEGELRSTRLGTLGRELPSLGNMNHMAATVILLTIETVQKIHLTWGGELQGRGGASGLRAERRGVCAG